MTSSERSATPPPPPPADGLIVGEIVGPFGVMGEVKLYPLTDYPERLRRYRRLVLALPDGSRQAVRVQRARAHKNIWLLKLRDINSVEQAETLRGAEVIVPPELAEPLPEGHFYLHDVIGLRVVTPEGEELGTVTDVLRNPANDVYVVGALLIPELAKVTRAGPDLKAVDRTLKHAQSTCDTARTTVADAQRAVDREQQRLQTAAVDVERIESEIETATRALKEILPKDVDPAPKPINAALEAQAAAARQRDAIVKRIDALRKKITALEPLVNQSAQGIAKLTATAKALADQIEEATREGDAAITDLRKHAKKWRWQPVIDLIEAKQNPRDSLDAMLAETSKECDELTGRQAALEQRVEIIDKKIARAAELRAQLEESRTQQQIAYELGLLLRANAFQQYVISSAMQVLAASATEHLQTLYPRFAIDVDDGQFQVTDHWQADQKRPARTLSGGETFVASLALALTLSERLPELRSAAAARLDSLFLDEGFGTLDRDTLETVITALEGLRSEERMVGIITHVPELAQRIETRIEVTATPTGSTLVLVGA